jgi:hypothetical protein
MKIILSISKNWWNWVSKIADICWILAIFWVTFWGIHLSNQISNIEEKIGSNNAQSALMSYFSLIEEWNLSGAYSLLSYDFKKEHSYYEFSNWLNNTIWFEGLKITPLTWKDTAIQKVFLVDFGFKKRWKIPSKSIRWMYVKYNLGKREINANSVLFENTWKPTACEFYHFDHCK